MSNPAPSELPVDELIRLLADREDLLARLAREASKERTEALSALERLNTALRDQEAEIARTRSSLEVSETRGRELAKELDASRDLSRQSEKDRLEAEGRLRNELETLKAEQSRQQENLNRITRELAVAEAIISERTREKAELSARLSTAEAEHREVRQALESELREKERTSGEQRMALEARVRDLGTEREALLQESRRLEREVARIEGLLGEAQARLTERERALANLARTSATERIEALRRIDAAATTEQALRQQIAAFEIRLETATGELQSRTSQVEELRQALQGERDARLADRERAADEIRGLEQQIAQLREERARTDEIHRQLKELQQHSVQTLENLRAETAELLRNREEAITRLESDLARTRDDSNRIQAELSATNRLSENELAAAKSEVAYLQNELMHLREEHSRQAAAAHDREQSLTGALRQLEIRTGEGADKTAGQISVLTQRLGELEQTYRKRSEEVSRLENLLAQREKILADIVGSQSEEVRRYESQLEAGRSRIRQLESALAAAGGVDASTAQGGSVSFLQDELAKLHTETLSLSRSLDAAVRKTLAEGGRTAELANQLTRIEGRLENRESAPVVNRAEQERAEKLAGTLEVIRSELRSSQTELRRELADLEKRISAVSANRSEAVEFRKLQTDLDQRLQKNEKHIQQMLSAFEEFTRQITISRAQQPTGMPAPTPQTPEILKKFIEDLRTENRSVSQDLRREIARLAESARERKGIVTGTATPAVPPPGGLKPSGLDRRGFAIAGIFGLLLATGIGTVIWKQLRLEQQIHFFANGQPELMHGRPATAGKQLPVPEPAVKFPVRTTEETVELAGRATGAQGVVLHIDGIFFAAVPVRGGKYLFDRIPIEPGTHKLDLWAFTPGTGFSNPLSGEITRTLPSRAARLSEPRPSLSGLNVERGPLDRREIGLTFDGDGADGAEVVLDTLRQKRIQTTIFLTGKFMDQNPGLVRQIVRDGHEVGNHTQTHPHLTTYNENNRHDTRTEVTKEWFQEELLQPAARFEEITGVPMAKIWRAPFGEVNPQILRWAYELGYRHIGWTRDYSRSMTLDSLDWVINRGDRNYQPGARIIERLLDFEQSSKTGVNGGIVLMHLGTQRPVDDSVGLHLPRLIDTWRERGYRFVKVSTWLSEDS